MRCISTERTESSCSQFYFLLSAVTGKKFMDELSASLKVESLVRKVEGVGFLVDVVDDKLSGSSLAFKLGYAHRVVCKVPALIHVVRLRTKGALAATTLFLCGFSTESVGTFAATLRETKRPSVYKKRGVGTMKDWLVPRKPVVKK